MKISCPFPLFQCCPAWDIDILQHYLWPSTTKVVSNEQLWDKTKQTPIETEIRKHKWGWIGHTLRKPASNITRQALDWNPQGKCKVGRPKQTWRRSTDAEIRAAGTGREASTGNWQHSGREASTQQPSRNSVRYKPVHSSLTKPLSAGSQYTVVKQNLSQVEASTQLSNRISLRQKPVHSCQTESLSGRSQYTAVKQNLS